MDGWARVHGWIDAMERRVENGAYWLAWEVANHNITWSLSTRQAMSVARNSRSTSEA
jgi:hypothetical protein